MPTSADRFPQIRESLAGLGICAASLSELDDDALTSVHRACAGLVSEVQKLEALAAAEMVKRSDTSLRQAGPSSRLGFVDPAAMVQKLGGGSRTTTMQRASPLGDSAPWVVRLRGAVRHAASRSGLR